MKLLLHACCAPCFSTPVKRLRGSFLLTAFYCNPNIHPEEEYALRLSEFRRYAADEDTEILEAPYEPEKWFRAVKGLEDEKEGGPRCEICFRLRIEETAKKAKTLSIGRIGTTLTAGPQKKTDSINKIGEQIAEKYDLTFLKEDFKKKDGFRISLEACKKLNIYRQNYCGCVFSRRK